MKFFPNLALVEYCTMQIHIMRGPGVFAKFGNQSLDCLFLFEFFFLNPDWLKLSHQPPVL